MKQLLIITLLIFGYQAKAKKIIANDDCTSQIVNSSSNENGIVKKINGEMVSTKGTMSLKIDPCNHTVLIEFNNKTYDLVLYKTDKSGKIHAATLDGKQIVKITVNSKTNEVEALIEDLIFTTYIDTKNIDTRAIANED